MTPVALFSVRSPAGNGVGGSGAISGTGKRKTAGPGYAGPAAVASASTGTAVE